MTVSERSVLDDNGASLDAKIEIGESFVVLQSRGGTKGTIRATNTEYSIALKALLSRFQSNQAYFVECYVDSNRVQMLPKAERVILIKQEIGEPVEQLFTLVCRRMQSVGKPTSEKRHVGNANKRIRFVFSGVSAIDLEKICNGKMVQFDGVDTLQLSSSDLRWAEGEVRLVSHLIRERASGLSEAKKAAFVQEHGKLFCENCSMDPVETYGDALAKACIEVHHSALAVSEMTTDHVTILEDLQCLCANCHRLVHAKLKLGSANRS